MQQQVNVNATIILSLSAEWDEEQITTFIRGRLGQAFTDVFPKPWNENESPVNFEYEQEAKIYGNE